MRNSLGRKSICTLGSAWRVSSWLLLVVCIHIGFACGVLAYGQFCAKIDRTRVLHGATTQHNARARSTIFWEPPRSVTNLYLKAALCRRPSNSERSIFEESARSLVMLFAIEVRCHCFQVINKVQRSEACSSRTCVCVCVCLRVSLLVGSH